MAPFQSPGLKIATAQACLLAMPAFSLFLCVSGLRERESKSMLIDLNNASLSELELLPGVGPAIAEKIVLLRPFARLDQLLNVKGIGPKRYATLTGAGPRVCIGSTAVYSASTAVKDGKGSSIKEDTSRAPAPAPPKRRPVAALVSPSSPGTLVDINSASLQELQLLHGIGLVLARRIVSARPFSRKTDLVHVKGIGSITYHKLEPHFTIDPSPNNTINRTSTSTSTRAYEQDPLEYHEVAAESGNDSGPLEFPAENGSRCAPHVCREADTSVRANLFSDLHSSTTVGSNPKRTAAAENTILVASWNIRNISKSKDVALLHRIAGIINEFDLVALQEVRDTIVLKRLKILLPGWDFVVSAPVGIATPPSPAVEATKTRSEHFAFMFRRSVARVTGKRSLFAGVDNVFDRPPFVAHFALSTSQQSTLLPPLGLTLVNVHVSCGEKQDRVAEVQGIKRLVRSLQEQQMAEVGEKRAVVVLGDFNLAPHEFGSSNNNFADRAIMTPLVCAPLSSTVSGNLCDNICMDLADITALQQQLKYQIESGVYRFDWRYYPHSKPGFATSMQHSRQLLRRRTPSSMAADNGDGTTLLPRRRAQEARMQCAYEISDHCPVWVAFAPRG